MSGPVSALSRVAAIGLAALAVNCGEGNARSLERAGAYHIQLEILNQTGYVGEAWKLSLLDDGSGSIQGKVGRVAAPFDIGPAGIERISHSLDENGLEYLQREIGERVFDGIVRVIRVRNGESEIGVSLLHIDRRFTSNVEIDGARRFVRVWREVVDLARIHDLDPKFLDFSAWDSKLLGEEFETTK